MELTAYFVVAEALANAVKHARADRLRVALLRDHDSLRVDVGDDGVGGADDTGGSGLRGLADRVDVLGGRLWLESPVGGGTRIVAVIPCAS